MKEAKRKEYILDDSIHIKLKSRKTLPRFLRVRAQVGLVSPVFALNNSLSSLFEIFRIQKELYVIMETIHALKFILRKSTRHYEHVFFFFYFNTF